MESIFSETYWFAGFAIQRGLGLVYLIAFSVALNQFKPLLGEKGLLPVPDFLKRVTFKSSPSIFHFHYSDKFFEFVGWSGLILSILATLGISDLGPIWLSMLVWGLLWILYLSIVNVGQTFYGFGWESMLLEAGFLAVFIGPVGMLTPVAVIYMFRWMLFRVEFGAGMIKIRGDQCWRDLTCLNYHHETQPMPNPLSRFFHFKPEWFHKIETGFNHFVQLIVPFGLFFPQPVSAISAAFIIVSQGYLMLSGNYAWLNFLTAILAFSGFSDGIVKSISSTNFGNASGIPLSFEVLIGALTLLIIWLSIDPVKNLLSKRQLMNFSFNPLHLVNTYGAFGSVTKKRMEVVVKGTQDNSLGPLTEWEEYEFKGKPTDTSKVPPQFAPYHLRLDWQMWFAAMSHPAHNPWFLQLVKKFLKNDEETLNLIENNPFTEEGPEYIKADLYHYRFSTPEEYAETGDIWQRELIDEYLRPISVETFSSEKQY